MSAARDLGLLFNLDALAAAVDALPPEQRAQIRWSMRDVDGALDSLLNEPIDTDLTANVTQTVLAALFEWAGMVELPYLEVGAELIREAFGSAIAALDDPTARVALDWLLAMFATFFEAWGEWVAAGGDVGSVLAEIERFEPETLFRCDETGLWRAEVLLFALDRGADTGATPDRLRLLVFEAVHELSRGLQALGDQFVLDPFPGETEAEAAERLLGYAELAARTRDERERSVLRILRRAHLTTRRNRATGVAAATISRLYADALRRLA